MSPTDLQNERQTLDMKRKAGNNARLNMMRRPAAKKRPATVINVHGHVIVFVKTSWLRCTDTHFESTAANCMICTDSAYGSDSTFSAF